MDILANIGRCRTVTEIASSLHPSRGGRPVRPSTVMRWIRRGLPLSDGSTLKLAAMRLPGAWMISDENLVEFIARLSADRSGTPPPAPAPAAAKAGERAERAEAELAAMGI